MTWHLQKSEPVTKKPESTKSAKKDDTSRKTPAKRAESKPAKSAASSKKEPVNLLEPSTDEDDLIMMWTIICNSSVDKIVAELW